MNTSTTSSRLTFILLFTALFMGITGQLYAQDQPGSAPGSVIFTEPFQKTQGFNPFHTPDKLQEDETLFSTTIFTFTEIIVFAYSNDTDITIVNAAGDTVLTKTLQKDEYHFQSFGRGVYRIFGSKSFTALVGDAKSARVQGYYAVDQSGRGTSTLFNTYMMRSAFAPREEFIVAAYENNTNFTIRDLDTGDLLHAGVINSGEFFTMPTTPLDKFLQVEASKPVSALSYGDQDYYVPSSNGTFTGTLFLGYSAYIGSWTNSITATGFYDDTEVTVFNVVTGDTIASYTLNEGEVNSIGINTPTYWRLESDKPVIAANIPYAGWVGSYAYMTRAMDRSGIGAGRLFYMPTIGSRIDVFSFADGNEVKIERLGSATDYPYTDTLLIHEGVLNAGEGYTFNSPNGRLVYKIQGSADVSVIQSNSGAGAEFMPLSFAQELPDLAVSSDGIQFNPEKESYQQGENIDVTVRVFNFGPIDAMDAMVHVYDGDPDGEGVAPLLHSETIPMVEGNSFETISFTYTVPNAPEFRQIVVKVDPEDRIRESNSANNKASRFIEPNEDLLPPIAVTVQATGALRLDEDLLPLPNPFDVVVTLLNTGEGAAQDVTVELIVLDGLEIDKEPESLEVGTIAPGQSVSLEWELLADGDVIGMNRYTIRVQGSNVEPKDVNRAVNVPDPVPQMVSLYSPEFGEVSVPLLTFFEWSTSPYARSYDMQLSKSSDFSDLIVDEESIDGTSYQHTEELERGTMHYWRVRAVNEKGSSAWRTSQFRSMLITDIHTDELPDRFVLQQNYPNPFNPSTQIRFAVPEQAHVELVIYSIVGEKIATLVNEVKNPGWHQATFDASPFSSGIYIFQLKAGSTTNTRHMLYLK